MIKKLLHITLIPLLLFSIADINRIALLVVSVSINNGCDALFCTCAGSCSCTLPGNHNKKEENSPKSLPVLINSPSTTTTCCPETSTLANTENSVRVCSCGHDENNSFKVILLRTLDKVILAETNILLSKFSSYTLKSSSSTLYDFSFIEEIFHPPRA